VQLSEADVVELDVDGAEVKLYHLDLFQIWSYPQVRRSYGKCLTRCYVVDVHFTFEILILMFNMQK
jgi:hypothetical protein